MFVHAYIAKISLSDWASFPSTVPWQPNFAPIHNLTLSLIEENMIHDWRGKQFTCFESAEIVVNDPHCASELAYSLSHIVRMTVGTNNKKAISMLSLYIFFSAQMIQSKRGMSYISSNLVSSNFVGQAVVATVRKKCQYIPCQEIR